MSDSKNRIYLVLLLFVHIAVAIINVEILMFGGELKNINIIFPIIYILSWIVFLRKSMFSQGFNKRYALFGCIFWGIILFISFSGLFVIKITDLSDGLLIILAFIFMLISPFISLNTKMVFFISIIMLCFIVKKILTIKKEER